MGETHLLENRVERVLESGARRTGRRQARVAVGEAARGEHGRQALLERLGRRRVEAVLAQVGRRERLVERLLDVERRRDGVRGRDEGRGRDARHVLRDGAHERRRLGDEDGRVGDGRGAGDVLSLGRELGRRGGDCRARAGSARLTKARCEEGETHE